MPSRERTNHVIQRGLNYAEVMRHRMPRFEDSRHHRPRNATEGVPYSDLSHLIHHPPMLLGPADFFHGVEAGEDEFDAGGADGGVAGRVDFEGFVPEGWDALEAV